MNLSINKHTNIKEGLTSAQVKKNKRNVAESDTGKSYEEIISDNVFTLFNAINVLLALMVVATGSFRNMLFIFVVLINTVVGIFQEVRSKKTLDDLALLNQQKVTVIRNGHVLSIANDQLVRNDIMILKPGDQISVDAVVVEGEIECNESILTGESDSIEKGYNDTLMSGSFVVSGQAKAQAVRIGDETYSHSILMQAKREKQYPSQLRDSIEAIIRFSTCVLIPAGMLLMYKGLMDPMIPWQQTVLSTVAAMIGMIPEGLILLTSTALALGAMRLARKKVLVQELYCIETLARVDTLCLDKTGTITQGKMKVVRLDGLYHTDDEELKEILRDVYNALEDDNATARAIREYVGKKEVKSLRVVPFSSARKASGVTLENGESYVVGAYSFVVNHPDSYIEEIINDYAKEGMRVLCVARAQSIGEKLKGNHEVIGLVCIQDVLRPDIQQTLTYFYKQDVDIKIISGDDARTVAALAKQAGVRGSAIDMSQVKNVEEVVEEHSVFGRVTPEQKRKMVQILKKNGHTVAMTGDGVNDVMALKEADCSIAMGSGAEATKSVSSLVLMKDQFSAMPSILRQGRNVINNIQRSASLFLVKTLFSFGLAILSISFFKTYPFEPIQLSMVSSLGIGIPGFILTLEPNNERVTGNFLLKVFAKAVPAALSVVVSVIFCYLFKEILGMNDAQVSTICTIVASWNSICMLYTVCVPMTVIRRILLVCMSLGVVIGIFVLNPIIGLGLVPLTSGQLVYLLCNLALIPDFIFGLRWLIDHTILKSEWKQA